MFEVVRRKESGEELVTLSWIRTMRQATDYVAYCLTCNYPEGTTFFVRPMEGVYTKLV